MTLSANEVLTLAAKAARGAGAPPAQAAGFGQAALAHVLAGRDPADLSRALAALPEGPVIDLPLAILRIVEAAVDGRAQGPLDTGDNASLAAAYVDALPFAATLDDAGLLSVDLTRPDPRRSVGRIELPEDLKAHWHGLAARILVPESAASRQAGAGAGLTDND